MTLVDSADSILMLYSYAGFPEKSWSIFEYTDKTQSPRSSLPLSMDEPVNSQSGRETPDRRSISKDCNVAAGPSNDNDNLIEEDELPSVAFTGNQNPVSGTSRAENEDMAKDSDLDSESIERDRAVKQNTMSGLSIALTLISILVAFRWVVLFIFNFQFI